MANYNCHGITGFIDLRLASHSRQVKDLIARIRNAFPFCPFERSADV
jgi:hypothetical protein